MGYTTTFYCDVYFDNINQDMMEAFDDLRVKARRFSFASPEEVENYKPEYVAKMKELSKGFDSIDDYVFEIITQKGHTTKWYEWDTDMVKLSKAFPKYIFKLVGKGEEPEDLWSYWYRDGKVQGGAAQIKYHEFNPKLFKSVPTDED